MIEWERLLDLPIRTPHYEKLIADPERVAREPVAFCGLPWDVSCRGFHVNNRVVSTFSYHQVRKPIYAGSVGRYRRYERHLAPLKVALGVSYQGT